MKPTILNVTQTILNVTPAACCRIHRREREELHARFGSRLNSNAFKSTTLARAKKKRAKPFALNHPSLLLQVASTPSLLGNSSITSIIDSTTTLLSALSTSSLKPSSNTHTSAWSCVSSVVQATQTAVSRSRAREAAAASFADESARKLAAFAVRSQLAGQAPIVFSKDTSALKTAVGGQPYCCCSHQCCKAHTEHIHYTCHPSDDAHSRVWCVSGSTGVLHLRCRHRRSLLLQRYVWHVTIIMHAFELCCASHVNSSLQTPPFLRLPHST